MMKSAARRKLTGLPPIDGQPVSTALLANGLLDALPDAIIAVDQSGTIVQVNSQTQRVFGYGKEELIGESLDKLVPERFRQKHGQDVEGFFRGAHVRPMGTGVEVYGLRKDGSEFPADISLSPVPTEQGVLIIGAIRDVSHSKRVEEDLRKANELREAYERLWESKTKLTSIIDLSQDAIIARDLEGRITTWNKGAEKIYGFIKAEVIGKPLAILIPKDYLDEMPRVLDRICAGESVEPYESVQVAKDGRILNVSISVSPILDMSGQVIGVSAIARDITAQKRNEDQLRQAQKMESLGRLAGGVAHDFNNLLMIIRATTDLIATDRIADEQLRGRLDDIVHASDRGISLVKQLLGFAKNQKLQPEPVDLNCVLKDLAEMLPRLLDENVELVVSYDKPLPVVQADRSQLFQAIVNLAINARDAMTQGGRLSIDAEAVVLDEYYACRCPEVRPGQYVMVAVSDSGTGIPKDIQAKMFDPFFTTKPAGKGTGLGLSVVHGIVHQYGGHLSVYSEPGIGTVIKLYFPVALEPLEKKEEPGQTGKAGTVLLAEDDMTLRRIIRETLVLNGYRVLEGENGLEALQQARHCRETIDVVVTDVMMPKMGGPELAQRVRAVCPRARIVYLSGYHEHTGVLSECSRDNATFFEKPFPLRELVLKVRELIMTSKTEAA